jgi:pentafunctional AROM polypeptide
MIWEREPGPHSRRHLPLAQDLASGALGTTASTSIVLLTDENVWVYHGARLVAHLREAGVRPLVRVLPPGEASKVRSTKEEVEDWMLANKCLRDTLLLALGGGVVGDMGGFIASTYMRGVAYVQLPTTLLAQVDSSIGGKTGLDTPAGKNLVGAFHQPRAVYADTETLATLPVREISNGLAEVVKTGLIADSALYQLLEDNGAALLGEEVVGAYGIPLAGEGPCGGRRVLGEVVLNAALQAPPAESIPLKARQFVPALTAAIAASIAVKVRVVGGDEKESGERTILNAGHTVGHGIEAVLAPLWLHGECVSVGLVVELQAARALGAPGVDSALIARVKRTLRSLGLPVAPPASITSGKGLDESLSHMSVDKKNAGGDGAGERVKCVFLKGVGAVLAPPYAHSVPLSLLRRIMSTAVEVVPGTRIVADAGAAPLLVRVPGSKSISNRALLQAGLAQGVTLMRGLLASDDTQVMTECLALMGAATTSAPDPERPEGPPCVSVRGAGGAFSLPPADTASPGGRRTLYVQNAGTASRFLASVAALLPLAKLGPAQSVRLAGNVRMGSRPIGPLVNALRSQGVGVEYTAAVGCPPLHFTAGLDPRKDAVSEGAVPASPGRALPGSPIRRRVVHLEAKLSSQYVSSILLAAPYFPAVATDEGSDASAHPPLSDPAAWVEVLLAEEAPTSLPYITMTIRAMGDFGVAVQTLAPNHYLVPRTPYAAPSSVYNIEPDASSASYPAAWAVIAGVPVTIDGVGSASMQGDAGFPALLGLMGASVVQGAESTTIRAAAGGLRGIDVNMANQTDCFMTLAVVAALAKGVTQITGIGNQRVKECDRIAAMVCELGKAGIEAWELSDGIAVRGTGLLGPRPAQGDAPLPPPAHSARVHCYDDHRIAMSFSLLGCVVPGIVLDDAACVDKTFPEWWDMLSGALLTGVVGVPEPAAAAAAPPRLVVLVGMRGTGKSSLSRAGAAALGAGWACVDLDREIEAAAGGDSCSRLVEEKGWSAFRAAEEAALVAALAMPRAGGALIACGGGIVETPACVAALQAVRKRGAVVIHVDRPIADVEEDIGRTVAEGADSGRPMYPGGLTLVDVAARRASLYASVASHTFAVLSRERDWRAVNDRFGRLVQQLVRPVSPSEAVAAGTGPLADTATGVATTFVCLAERDVRDVAGAASAGPADGPAWDAVASALHAITRDADAVELRVDCLAGVADARTIAEQLSLLRAGLARGAALALGSTAERPRVMPASVPKPIIYTVRSVEEGGRFASSPQAYAALVRLGISLGAEWIDLECGGRTGGLSLADARALIDNAHASGCRVIGSSHWPSAPAPSLAVLSAAATAAWNDGAGCDVIKLVGSARDAEDAVAMAADVAALRRDLAARAVALGVVPPSLISIAMGGSGSLTRVLNSVLTPVTHPLLRTAAAPGQLSAAAIRACQKQLGLQPPLSFYLFGSPVSQSLSPSLHNAGFAALGLSHRYGLVETADAAFVDAILRGRVPPATTVPYEGLADPSAWAPGAFAPTVGGGSVTMPLKQTILPFCDELGPAAAAIGAVNAVTVLRSGSTVRVRGDNTDWCGVYHTLHSAIAQQGRLGEEGSAMLIVGAGGTCLAAAYAARQLGLRVLVANRTAERAAAVVARLREGGQADAQALPLDADALSPEALSSTFGVKRVSAIVCTLPPGAAWTAPNALLELWRPAVLDVSYRPRLTALLTQARAASCPAIEGVSMLIGQGLAAFGLWTGKTSGNPVPALAPAVGVWGPGVPTADMAAAAYRSLEGVPGLL